MIDFSSIPRLQGGSCGDCKSMSGDYKITSMFTILSHMKSHRKSRYVTTVFLAGIIGSTLFLIIYSRLDISEGGCSKNLLASDWLIIIVTRNIFINYIKSMLQCC